MKKLTLATVATLLRGELGGSRRKGTATPDADWDFFYTNKSDYELDSKWLTLLAEEQLTEEITIAVPCRVTEQRMYMGRMAEVEIDSTRTEKRLQRLPKYKLTDGTVIHMVLVDTIDHTR